jgi:hypothetical protein
MPLVLFRRNFVSSLFDLFHDAVWVFRVSLDDGPAAVEQRRGILVRILLYPEPLIERAVGVGVAVPQDHGIDVNSDPDIGRRGRPACALFQRR